jgi:superfamily II DNA or RNA helicase
MTTLFSQPVAINPRAIARDYQLEDHDSVFRELATHRSTLCVEATGLGKTVEMGLIADTIVSGRSPIQGKILFLTHRNKIAFQTRNTIQWITGLPVSLEMGNHRANLDDQLCVATVQTLGRDRKNEFKPDEYALVVADEAHCAATPQWHAVIDYFMANPKCKLLGFTATPDRRDKRSLKKLFETVATNRPIRWGIDNGWLVPVDVLSQPLPQLDLSKVEMSCGDLNTAQLGDQLETEKVLHPMIQPMLEIVCQAPLHSLDPTFNPGQTPIEFRAFMDEWLTEYQLRKALIFGVRVKHAELIADIINRWIPDGKAAHIHGGTLEDERTRLYREYKSGKIMFLANVDVATVGFDETTVQIVVLGRPSTSRAWVTQAIGRATRPLKGVVDAPGLTTPELRKAAIAASGKPSCLVIHFNPISARHQLQSPFHALAGTGYDLATIARAKKNADKEGRKDGMLALDEAKEEITKEREEQKAKRAQLRIQSTYSAPVKVDMFKGMNMSSYRERPHEVGKAPSEKMYKCLKRAGAWRDGMTFSEARQAIQYLVRHNWQLPAHVAPVSNTPDEIWEHV